MMDSDKTARAGFSRRFRSTTARISAAAALILAGLAYGLIGQTAAEGVLLGGTASVIGFAMMASGLNRLGTIAPEKLQLSLVAGTYMRLGVYGLSIFVGYLLDRESLEGLYGAVAGLMVVRLVPAYVAVQESRRNRSGESVKTPDES